VELEEVIQSAGRWSKVRAALRATLYPAGSLVACKEFQGDAAATILFSSGSTGTPKGVVLSHHNIQSNVEASDQLLRLNGNDTMSGTLPFFHALGYTCTMWLPLLSGCAASYHPNPLDGAGIARMVRRNACTILVATPTFLVAYMRRAKPEDFRTLRHCIAGAEKLKPKLADSFEEKFGVRPLEGYGATELSPLACVNVPDVERYGRIIQGTKPGSIGQPIPGVAVRIRNPETGESISQGEEGVMWIRGPNVMIGYLHNPEATREVLRDGWYNTRDVAYIDSDGFITITDRLARFSKIGGEMVPHVAIEDVLMEGLDTHKRVVAVTAVPDEKRGERLIVLYTAESGGAEKLQQILHGSDLPNLWRPSPKSFHEVADLPELATGKLDLGAVRKIAADLNAR
jgi:acyl-[acyl-carrier-protein]-phospholipid O-acyltransferase/long-chain-fatty-acid--[acyl-carrier-protein] ligase